MVNSIEIEYLEPKSEFRVGAIKNIAVPNNNKDDIKKMYPNEKKAESNADMLSQNFSTAPEIVPIPNKESNVYQNISENNLSMPTIPIVNSDLEKTPVDLNMNNNGSELSMPTQNIFPEIKPIDMTVNMDVNQGVTMPGKMEVSEVKAIDLTDNNIQNNNVMENNIEQTPIDANVDIMNVNSQVSPISDVEKNETIIKSDFNVGNGTNYFDLPENNSMLVNNNLPELPQRNEEIKSENIKHDNKELLSSNIKENIIEAEIAILESDIKYYEGLAENNRKKIELLRKQYKKEENEINLENTASNLFNSSGMLDDDKVLGKTPMPNIRVA